MWIRWEEHPGRQKSNVKMSKARDSWEEASVVETEQGE